MNKIKCFSEPLKQSIEQWKVEFYLWCAINNRNPRDGRALMDYAERNKEEKQ